MRRKYWWLVAGLIGSLIPMGLVGCGGGGQSIIPNGFGNETSSFTTPAVTRTKAQAEESDPESGSTETRGRAVATRPVVAPTLISPLNEAEVVRGQGINFLWNAVVKGKKYMIAISSSSSFSRQTTYVSDNKGTALQKSFKTFPNTFAEGRTYWRVRASDLTSAAPVNNRQWGPYSSTGTFMLVNVSCGTSTTGTLKGVVTDKSTGAGVSGAKVRLDTDQEVTTDSRGNYTLRDVPVGSRSGLVSKSGYLSNAVPSTQVSPRTCVSVNIQLTVFNSGGPPPPPIFP